MIAYIWARESNKYDRTVYSLTSQVEKCLEQAGADGYEIPESNIFRVKFSGADLFKIPELKSLFALLEQEPSKPKRIYCYTQDRMVRGATGADIFYITTRFRHAGAELVLVKKPKDMGTIAGQIEALVDGHAASEEIGKILDRTMRGKITRVRSGKIQNFGPEKYGHVRDKIAGTATLHPDQAPVVRKLFDWILAGESLHECCRRLNDAGIKTATGHRWHLSSVARVLSDPAHCDQAKAWRLRRENGSVSARPAADQIPLTGVYQPIVTPAEFYRVQEVLSKNKGAKTRNKERPALLRGFVFCAACSRPCYVVSSGAASYYRCASSRGKQMKPGDALCPGKAIRTDWLDGAIWREACEMLRSPTAMKELEAEGLEGGNDNTQIAELELMTKSEKQKLAQQSNLLRELRDATPNVGALIKADLNTLQSELANLSARRAEIERYLNLQSARAHQLRSARQMAIDAAGELENASFEQRRLILDGMVIRIEINRPDWKITPL